MSLDAFVAIRDTLGDRQTQTLSWTLRKELVRYMLNITTHLLQHLKSVLSSVPQK